MGKEKFNQQHKTQLAGGGWELTINSIIPPDHYRQAGRMDAVAADEH